MVISHLLITCKENIQFFPLDFKAWLEKAMCWACVMTHSRITGGEPALHDNYVKLKPFQI